MTRVLRKISIMAVVALFGASAVGITPASAGPVTLSCGSTHTGSSSGSPYLLSATVNGCTTGAITLDGANYTIDLNGYDVSCVDASAGDGTGININGHHITIIDSSAGKTSEVKFCDVGIQMNGAIDDGDDADEGFNTVDGITIRENKGDQCRNTNGDGVLISNLNNNMIKNNRIIGNGPLAGVTVHGASILNTIQDNEVSDNAWPIKCTVGSFTNAISFYYYDTDGIRIEPFATSTTVTNNRVERNGLDGIAVFTGTAGNVVAHNTVTDNGTPVPAIAPGYTFYEPRQGDGIRIFGLYPHSGNVGFGVHNQSEGNTSCGNQGHGIYGGRGGSIFLSNSADLVTCGTNWNGSGPGNYYDLTDDPATPGVCTNIWVANTGAAVNKPCTEAPQVVGSGPVELPEEEFSYDGELCSTSDGGTWAIDGGRASGVTGEAC